MSKVPKADSHDLGNRSFVVEAGKPELPVKIRYSKWRGVVELFGSVDPRAVKV